MAQLKKYTKHIKTFDIRIPITIDVYTDYDTEDQIGCENEKDYWGALYNDNPKRMVLNPTCYPKPQELIHAIYEREASSHPIDPTPFELNNPYKDIFAKEYNKAFKTDTVKAVWPTQISVNTDNHFIINFQVICDKDFNHEKKLLKFIKDNIKEYWLDEYGLCVDRNGHWQYAPNFDTKFCINYDF